MPIEALSTAHVLGEIRTSEAPSRSAAAKTAEAAISFTRSAGEYVALLGIGLIANSNLSSKHKLLIGTLLGLSLLGSGLRLLAGENSINSKPSLALPDLPIKGRKF